METPQSTRDIAASRHEIRGSYGDGIIKIDTLCLPWSHRVVINIHGTFGSMDGSSGKYRSFARSLVETGASSAVLYESSRKDIPIDPSISDRYKQKQAKFIGKTFSDELEDARRVVSDVLLHSQERLGIAREKLEITLNGNSLGGILAFYLAWEFPEITNIVSVGTGLRLEIKDVPILNTFPAAEEIREKVGKFHGKYRMIYGTEDDVFTKQSFMDLLATVGSSKENGGVVELEWVDHTFWKMYGSASEAPYERVCREVISILGK